jgi:Trm5-related predicted tRNA methylase
MQTKQETFKSSSQFVKGGKNPPKTVQTKKKKSQKMACKMCKKEGKISNHKKHKKSGKELLGRAMAKMKKGA